ncbi:DUF2917 domain-containing protein [Geomonas sp. RF6]|uniref:DUF2917 domain-containing protein n=1 Tax=Geomonas sp. RF6 TaxID=2897342 RepID=UPI001E438BED|nr:DUF2917 domain-containing protein [Geomonas sp. RF6]UFS70207.1 DUF2917 domain-containing protein [Geomonas sp. RF6]
MNYLLEKGEVLTLVTTPAMEAVEVVTGRVWLTKEDDGADYCIDAGSLCSIKSAKGVVIEALESASVSVKWKMAPSSVRVAMVKVEHRHCVPQAS